MDEIKAVDIITLPSKKKKLNDIPRHLPDLHALFCGETSSGKTLLVFNLLMRKTFPYNKYYETIDIISPTAEDDEHWLLVQDEYKPKKNQASITVTDPGDDIESIMENIYEAQKEIPKSDRKPRLMVLDDCLGLVKINSFLNQIFARGRHIGLHCWILSQKFTGFSREVRNNTGCFVLFDTKPQELKTIVEAVVSDRAEFISKFKEATREPYSFFSVKPRENPKYKYTNSFKKYL
jgi:hypothetical protein